MFELFDWNTETQRISFNKKTPCLRVLKITAEWLLNLKL